MKGRSKKSKIKQEPCKGGIKRLGAGEHRGQTKGPIAGYRGRRRVENEVRGGKNKRKKDAVSNRKGGSNKGGNGEKGDTQKGGR